MSHDLVIPPGFLSERAAAHAIAAKERLSAEHPDADTEVVDAVVHELVDAYYAGATALAGELFSQLTEFSERGQLLTRTDDGLVAPIWHLHVDQAGDGLDE
jgi:hypothetical protein